jgi:transcriptional regulator with GAF, ATPase, and Fis domain
MVFDIIDFSGNMPPQCGKIEIDPFSAEQIRNLNKSNKVTVCIADNSLLAEMKKDTLHFLDKKTKHPKKQLTWYFKEKDERIPFLDGNHYSDCGQLKRSIVTFIRNTISWKKSCLFFICVSKELFDKVYREVSEKNRYKERFIAGKYENPLLNLISPVDASLDLKMRYIGNSEPCMLVRQMIAIAAQHVFPVLILGESGTGKEVVARTIHECSDRKAQPFVAINCGAISPYLFESELFGHMKGTFPGAYADKKGLWVVANGGTLFLDEIGDLSLEHQVKILKVLEDGVVLPVGGTHPVRVNARIIAATNKNIETLIANKKKEFREDLYYRISTFIISTPPLSSHPEDIPELTEKEWSVHCKKKLTAEAIQRLKEMTWPGNVRSLKHFLHRLYAMFGDINITSEHIDVLQRQELEVYLKSTRNSYNNKSKDDKDFEKTVMKMEYLLKAALCCDDGIQRKSLLNEVRSSLDEMMD